MKQTQHVACGAEFIFAATQHTPRTINNWISEHYFYYGDNRQAEVDISKHR